MPIILAVLALPLVEIALFVTLGAWLGLWRTLAWVVLTGIAGVLILRTIARAGIFNRSENFVEGFRGRMSDDPLSPVAHQGLVGLAAAFLILPGFFTDALGILLLFPPVRRGLLRLLAWRMHR